MLFCGIKKYAFKLGHYMLNSFYLLSLKDCITSIFLDFPNLYSLNAGTVNPRICSLWFYREGYSVTVSNINKYACMHVCMLNRSVMSNSLQPHGL